MRTNKENTESQKGGGKGFIPGTTVKYDRILWYSPLKVASNLPYHLKIRFILLDAISRRTTIYIRLVEANYLL